MNKENNLIKIFDTTMRDGEQSPGASMNIEEKLKIAVALEDLGVDIIEAGFPAASKEMFLSSGILGWLLSSKATKKSLNSVQR